MLENLRKYVLDHKTELFFAFLIFLLAFGVRGQLMTYDLMFEFDSYFHARIVEFVAQTLTIPSSDPLAYYQLASQGGAALPGTGWFFWAFSAFLFKLFTLNAPYSKTAWIVMVKILPALYGALICVALFYMGKEFYGRKFGAVLAVLAATMPAFAYRTMAGFFEDDSFGFLPMVLGMIFFARAVKGSEFSRRTATDSALAAIFFAIMAWSWGVFILVPLILIAWLPFTLFLMWFRREPQEKIFGMAKNFAIVLLIMSVLATAGIGSSWIGTTGGYLTKFLPFDAQGIKNIEGGGGDSSSVYSVTVGEEQQGFRFWGNKYSALILFPFIALPLLAYRILRKKDDVISSVLFFWIAVTMVMAFTKLKFTYTFGIPVAISGAVVVHEFFEMFGKRQGFEKKTVALGLGFMILVGIAAGMFFVPQNVPQIEENTGWKETVYWIQANTPKDSKLFNWWDEGHWLSFIGERSVITDNRNMSLPANAAVASFMLAPSEEEAYRIVKGFKSDYIVVSEDLVGKTGSLGLYAFGVGDPRTSNFYSAGISCSARSDQISGQKSYACGSNTLSEAQYNALPATWSSEPNQLISQTQRAFLYRSPSTGTLFLLNKASNDAFMTKLFFAPPDSIKHFALVYSNKQVRVFKVN